MQSYVNTSSLNYPHRLSIGESNYTVEVKEFPKKNSSVIVKNFVIEVRLSSRLSLKQKQHHIDELLNSISKKLEKKTTPQYQLFDDVVARGYFYCGGRKYFIEKISGNRVTQKGDIFYIGVNSNFAEKKIEKLLIEEFRASIEQRVAFINSISYQYKYKNVDVKRLSSKWGHCTSQNELLFNIALVNASQEVFDYVIYHELAHIAVKNHSQRFWREVERFCPNYKELRNALKRNPPQLFSYEL